MEKRPEMGTKNGSDDNTNVIHEAKKQLEEKLCEYGSVEFIANLIMKEIYAQSFSLYDSSNPMAENPFGFYALGMFLTHNNLDAGEPHPNKVDEFIQLLIQYFNTFNISLIFDEQNCKLNDLIPFHSQLHKIHNDLNPHIYPHQLDDYYQQVFLPLDDHFDRYYGFSIKDARKFTFAFSNCLNNHMDTRLQFHADAVYIADSKNILTVNIDEYCKQNNILNKSNFKAFLNTLSCTFGEQFPNFKNPLSDNLILHKPFIKLNENEFFLAKLDLLHYNLYDYLEYLLKNKEKTNPPIWNKFVKLKSDYLENKSLEFFSRIFPKKCLFQNLYYWMDGKRFEVDLLCIYDNKIFIIESKSGNLTSYARREGREQLRKRLSDLIKKAQMQATCTKSYMKSQPQAQFWDKTRDNLLLEIDSTGTSYEFIFINVTLEYLGSLATGLKNIDAFSFFKCGTYPWSVYLHDLDVVTDILREPIYFIHYVEQRLKVQNQHIFHSQSELVLLGYYLNYGIFYTESISTSRNVSMIALMPHFMDPIEKYYLEDALKPKLTIPQTLGKLLLNIQKYQNNGFTKLTSLLLNFSLDSKTKLDAYLKKSLNKSNM